MGSNAQTSNSQGIRLKADSMSLVEGKFQLIESHHFDEYLQALSVPSNMRKRGIVAAPFVEVKKVGDMMSIKSESLIKKTEVTFKLGEQFQENTVEGKKCLSTVSEIAPNTLKHERLGTEGGKDTVCIRDFLPDKMKVVCTVEDIETTRVYDRLLDSAY